MLFLCFFRLLPLLAGLDVGGQVALVLLVEAILSFLVAVVPHLFDDGNYIHHSHSGVFGPHPVVYFCAEYEVGLDGLQSVLALCRSLNHCLDSD
jgi:hypothetical protein